jgi:hypothetical protein
MRKLVLALTLSLAAAAHASDQVRTAAPFTSISVQGPISVTVDRGATQSVTVRGSERFVRELSSQVVDGQLRLSLPDRTFHTQSGDQRVIITVPELRAFSGKGAGETSIGNVRGERLDVDYKGAGSIRISGEVKTFNMNAEGAGEVDTKALIANNVNIHFKGVGDVRVYAKDRLDADVKGMGSLTYFGRPRSVNKSVAGLGQVSAGD